MNAVPTTYTYPSGNSKLSSVGGTSYTYDAMGNVTVKGTQSYVTNAAAQMGEAKISGVTVGAYTYNAYNQRTKKVAGGNTTHYVYGPGGALLGEYDGSGNLIREYIHLNGEPLAQIDAGSPETILYLHTDHLATSRFATNSAGSVVWSWDSGAFGKEAPTGSATINLRFPGQYYDAETGLHYNWHRYYDPATGRYITSDPLGLAAGLNTYGYAKQNPLSFVDRDGLNFTLNPGIGGILVQIALDEIKRLAGVYSNWWNGTGGVTDEEAACETLWLAGPAVAGIVVRGLSVGVRWAKNTGSAGSVIKKAEEVLEIIAKKFNKIAESTPPKKRPIGFAPGEGASALTPNRLQNGTRHLTDAGLLPAWSGKNSPQIIRDLLGPILENPLATFDHTLTGGAQVKGFIGEIDGQIVAIMVYKDGPLKGQLATSIVPSPQQLANWGYIP